MLTSTKQGHKTTLYLVPSQETEVVFEASSPARAKAHNAKPNVLGSETPSWYRRMSVWLNQLFQRSRHAEQIELTKPWQDLQELSSEAAPLLGRHHQLRSVRGIADRMPRLVDEHYPFPARDMVFLGESRDYPDKVLALQYDNHWRPVVLEGTQLVARGLHLDTTEPVIQGVLILNDGSSLPIEIHVIIAV